MISQDSTASSGAQSHAHPDNTDTRIRASLASVRLWRESFRDGIDEAMQRGRSLIERLALSSDEEEAPSLRLTAEQVADVLTFIHYVEPLEPARWWMDGEISHVCGFGFVLDALAQSLRESDKKG